MKFITLALFVVLFAANCIVSVAATNTSASNIDLKELSKIEKILCQGDKTAVTKEFNALKSKLKETSEKERAVVLKNLAQQSKWGTSERYVDYYVCAWYGLNYISCRNYLLNVSYWWERGFRHNSKSVPFSFEEDSSDHLYALYEHNLDFSLLHDIVTTVSDGAGSETIIGICGNAMINHPRGMLHVAAISNKGRAKVTQLLKYGTDYEEHIDQVPQNTLKSYIKRIANDPKDSLYSVARQLLEKH